jgi:hypothetical protein
LELDKMSGSFNNARGSNIPYAFNPSANHPAIAAESVPIAVPTQDRLIVGVDFGTTYSGRFPD